MNCPKCKTETSTAYIPYPPNPKLGHVEVEMCLMCKTCYGIDGSISREGDKQ